MGGGLESRCVGRVYGADGASAPYNFFTNNNGGIQIFVVEKC